MTVRTVFTWRRCETLVSLAILLLTLFVTSGVRGQATLAKAEERGQADALGFEVALREGLLIVDARDAPLEEVLREVANRAGARLKLVGDTGRIVTFSFALRVEEGIRHLIGDHGLAILYTSSDGETTGPALSEIRVYGRADGRVEIFEPRTSAGGDELLPGDLKSRLQAVRELHAYLDDPEAVDQLAVALRRDGEPKVRRLAAFGLGNSGDPAAIAALGAALSDSDRSVRFQAIHGLSEIGDQEAVHALVDVLLDNDPAVRLQTVLALRRIGSRAAARALSTVLIDDNDTQIRRAVVRTLERLGGREAWWALYDAAAHDDDPAVREAAKAAIRRHK